MWQQLDSTLVTGNPHHVKLLTIWFCSKSFCLTLVADKLFCRCWFLVHLQLQHNSRSSCTNPGRVSIIPTNSGQRTFFFFFFKTQWLNIQENCSYPETPSHISSFTAVSGIGSSEMGFRLESDAVLLTVFLTSRVQQRSCVYICVHNFFHPNEEILQCNYTHIQACTWAHRQNVYMWKSVCKLFLF